MNTNELFVLLAITLLAGCGNPTDTDTDTDADADADTDADTDTDVESTIRALAGTPVTFEVDKKPTSCGETTECVVPANEGSHEVSVSKDGYLFVDPDQTVKVGKSGEVLADFSGEGQYGLEVRDGVYRGARGEYDVVMGVYTNDVDSTDFIAIDLGTCIWGVVTDDTFYGELENGSYIEGLIISETEIFFSEWSAIYPDNPPAEDTITYVRP